jgi:phospholipase A1/A2
MSSRRAAPAGTVAAGVFLCTMSGVSAVHADTPGEACLSIPDEALRLDCFDEAIGAAVRSATAEGAAIVLKPAGVPSAGPSPPQPGLMIESAWGLQPDSRKAYVRLHQPNYLLFARYTNDVNREPYEPLFDAFADQYDFENLEAKFQLSFKGRLLSSEDRRWGLWFAYTQQSQWQVYSDDISRPFRETNYMPELFGSFRPDLEVGGLRFNLLNFGYTHQSNGRADPISRSWDRLFVEGGLDSENFALIVRAWTRIEPSAEEDDNPDITDYLGHGQVTALYRWRENTFTLMGRGNPSTGKGAAQFSWTSRPILGPLRVHFQLFSGYGESLIDYDWNQTTVGLGVTLNDLL